MTSNGIFKTEMIKTIWQMVIGFGYRSIANLMFQQIKSGTCSLSKSEYLRDRKLERSVFVT